VRTLALCLAAALLGACTAQAVEQPFPFNHRVHFEGGVACVDCHQGVDSGPVAGIPKVESCLDCHADDITNNPEATPLIARGRGHGKAGTELGFRRLYALPGHVYYSHRRHVGIAKLECPVCHGDIGQSVRPPERPIAATLRMETCMDCHERSGVEDDCAWCHH